MEAQVYQHDSFENPNHDGTLVPGVLMTASIRATKEFNSVKGGKALHGACTIPWL